MNDTTSNDLTLIIHKLLRGLRISRGYSQNLVFHRIGVDVSKYESGKCVPKLNSINKLCNLYGISLSGFLAICEECLNKRIDMLRAMEILKRWSDYDKVLHMAIEMITKEKKAN